MGLSINLDGIYIVSRADVAVVTSRAVRRQFVFGLRGSCNLCRRWRHFAGVEERSGGVKGPWWS